MENIKINPESANLVLKTFQKINTLKKTLNNNSYCQLKEIIESGSVLNEMMNNALSETTVISFKSKLFKISKHIENTIIDIEKFKTFDENKEVKIILDQILGDIMLLQTKIKVSK